MTKMIVMLMVSAGFAMMAQNSYSYNSNGSSADHPNSIGNTPKDEVSIITNVSGVKFGSKPRGKVERPSTGLAYCYTESIPVKGNLIRGMTVYYTPITKQLFQIDASVDYGNLNEIVDLIKSKYKVNLQLSSSVYQVPFSANEKHYVRGNVTVGDVKISIYGMKSVYRYNDGSGRSFSDGSSGRISYLNMRLLEIYLSEKEKCPEKIAEDKANKRAAEKQRKREEQMRLQEQRERNKKLEEL